MAQETPHASQSAAVTKSTSAVSPSPAQKAQSVSGLDLVRFRNFFYRDGYRNAMMALLGSIGVNMLLIGLVVYQFSIRPAPVYFATQSNGSLIELKPLDEPLVSEELLLTWAGQAAIAAYTYDFLNYRQDFEDMKQYFTASGFDNYVTGLKQSGNLDVVLTKRLVVKGAVAETPVIVMEGPIKGHYSWKVQVPMVVLYQSNTETINQHLLVTMLISRVSTLEKIQGIAITQFVPEETKSKQ